MASQSAFDADLAKYEKAFRDADAVITFNDGFQGIDESRVPPSVLSGYRLLMQYGYANGLLS